MAASKPTNTKSQEQLEDEFKQLQLSLPKEIWFGFPMRLYQGFWCPEITLESLIAFQTYFQAYDSDIILASLPKTGTTWLKSLIFTIVNRKKYCRQFFQFLFRSTNPHELILYLEMIVFKQITGVQPNLSEIPLPRLFATHVPYPSLPDSMKTSKSRIVYVCRNPLDTFISLWHFFLLFEIDKSNKVDMAMMEEYLSKYCMGVCPSGPYEDHVLGYWKESKQNPQKVLFLEYEGLKKEPKAHLKKLAEFLGCPFTEEEEKGNVIDEIIELCSLKSLKDMEINKRGKFYPMVENKAFFRTGEVGGWTKYLTAQMAKQFDQMLEKLEKAGFSFTYYNMNH